MTQPTQDQFFAGGGEGLKWPADVVEGHYHDRRLLNVWRGGRITAEPVIRNQTEYKKPGVVRTWDDGTPRQQLVVNLRCDGSRQGIMDERNSQNPQDYGDRALYIKTGLRTAVMEALREQNLTKMAAGGELYVAWIGEAPTEYGKPGRVYAAKYFPPQPGVALPPDGPAAALPQQPPPAVDPWGQAPATPPPAPAPQAPTQPPAFQQPAAPPPAQNPWGPAPTAPPTQAPAPAAANPWGASPAQQQAPAAPPNPWG